MFIKQKVINIMGQVKEINIKNQTYYFSSLLKIDKKSCKNIDSYYVGYITIKKN